MQFYTANDFVDVDTYEERLNEYGEIYADLVGIGMYSQQQRCRAATLHRLCLKYINLHSKLGYSSLCSDAVIDYLQKSEGVPQKNFRKKGVARDSLDKKKVLIPLLKNGYAPDFLKMYIEHQESDSRSNNMTALYKRLLPNEKVRGWYEPLTPIPFSANRNVNLRFNYSNENLISFPRDMNKVIKAKEGYVLAWGDFAQSDARIAYNLLLRDDTNIEYIRAFPDDIYAGFANWVREFQKQELEQLLKEAIKFKEEVLSETGTEISNINIQAHREQLSAWRPFTGFKNKEERDIYKVYVLETIYGTRNHRVSEAAKFISTLGKVLDSCPKYKRFWNDIKKRAAFGVPLRVHCYMGHVEHVAAFDGTRINETLFKCLNYPVQGGTSEIMILTVNRILDKFYSLGYTTDDIHVYYIRHDEPVFQLKKSVMRDSWIFKDFGVIQVDDWIPLRLDFSFGRTYTEEEDEFMEEFLLSSKINIDRLTVCEPKTPAKQYYPLENLLEIAIYVERLSADRALLAVYNMNDNSYVVRSIPVSSEIADNILLSKFVDKYLINIYKQGYQQIVIYNNKNHYADEIDGVVPVVRLYRPSSSKDVFRANIIALAALSTMKNVEVEIVEQNQKFLSSLGRCTLFGGETVESAQSDTE